MKRLTRSYRPGTILTFATLLVTFPTFARADEPAPGSAPAPEGRREKMRDAGERLADELGLTDEQRARMKPLFEQERAELDALRADTTVTKEDRHAKAGVIHRKYRDLRDAILTPEQRAKADKMRENWKHHGDKGDKPAEKPADAPK